MFAASAVNIGNIVGGFSSGFLAAKFGRRTTLMLSSAAAAVGWFFTAIYPHVAAMITGIFIMGTGTGINWAIYSVFIGELVRKKSDLVANSRVYHHVFTFR